MDVLKMLWKTIKIFFSLIFSIIVCFFIFYFISNFIASINGEKKFTNIWTIVSPSMKPNINVYDVVVEFRVKENDLKIGDIITFKSDMVKDWTVTHRIVNKVEDSNGIKYITKGDNNTTRDPEFITYDDIYGKVYFRIPQMGRLQFFASTSLGWSIIIFIPCVIILFVELYKLLKAYRIRNNIKSLDDLKRNKDIKDMDKKIRALQERSNKIEEN